MELTIFITTIIFSFILLVCHSVFDTQKWIVMISGFIFIILGVLSIGQGIEIGSTVLQNSFTNNVGLILSLFGLSIATNVILENVRLSRVSIGGFRNG